MTNKVSEERRHYLRVPFDAEVLLIRENHTWACHLIDISLKGILLEYPESMGCQPGEIYLMEFNLSGEASIRMHVNIVHCEDAVAGLIWHDIDLDSLTHLRRLLELNLNDPDELHREISELG